MATFEVGVKERGAVDGVRIEVEAESSWEAVETTKMGLTETQVIMFVRVP